MRDIEAVCFDLDRTLCAYDRPTSELLAIAFEAAGVEPFFTLSEYASRFDDFAAEVTHIDELRDRCFRALAEERGFDPAIGSAVADEYNARRDPAGVSALPGARAVVERASSAYRTALITNGFAPVQRRKLEAIGLEDRFDAVVYAGTDTAFKPDPEPFEHALDELGTTPDRAVHVGDSFDHDVIGAKGAGLQAVWIDADAGSNARSSGGDPVPEFVVERIGRLRPFPWD